MKDVAERARVSVSTVSHVLNGTRKVAEGTRVGVLAAVEELGYRPNLLAKGLKTRRTYTLGLLIPDIQNPFFTSVVRGVEDVALSRGYHLFLCNTDEDAGREDEYVVELAKKGVDGLMVAPSASRAERAGRLRSEGVPFVFVDRRVEGVEADVVGVDNRAGMRLVAEHLVGMGHRRVGMVSGPLDKASGRERYEGLKGALEELGSGLEDRLVRFGDFKTAGGREGARGLMDLGTPPTAIVAANNQMTLGALLEIEGRGLRVPEDVSVVGFDDPEWAPLVSPPLTAVAQPTYEMGVRAAGLLLDRIEGVPEAPARSVLLEPWLVVRGSVARVGEE